MKKIHWILFGFFVLIFAFFIAPFVIHRFAAKPLPIHGKVIEFAMTDTDGKPFGTNQLRGKVWVADFIFTSCPGQCPRMTAELTKIYRSYLLEPVVNFVSFTVDPERDSPKVLKKYADERKLDVSKWHFLTASLVMVQKVMVDGFHIGTDENPLFHSGRFVLVDRDLYIRGYYDAETAADIKKLFSDVAELIKEPYDPQ